jgi:hypothetical protein
MTSPRRSLLFLAAIAILGCGPKKTDDKPKVDPDANSGPDGKRSGAAAMEVNKLVTDEVNFDKQDMTDWKMVDLKGKPGLLTVNLHWDNEKSDMNLDVFDAMGTPVATSPGPQPGAQDKKLVVQIDKLGVYYIRITAPKAHDGSVYTLEAKWDVEEPPPPVVKEGCDPPCGKHQQCEENKCVEKKSKPVSHEPRKPKEFAWETGVQGRIVSSYREGGNMVLHIDKGSAAGIKVGSPGTILDGPSGATALDGGTFKVTEVIDDSKCIAKTGLHSIGRNNRVSIMTR